MYKKGIDKKIRHCASAGHDGTRPMEAYLYSCLKLALEDGENWSALRLGHFAPSKGYPQHASNRRLEDNRASLDVLHQI